MLRIGRYLLLSWCVLLCACQTDEHGSEVSIAYLKSFYNGIPREITQDIKIRGRVISNDRYGNFYKELVIEDNSAGIIIKLDIDRIYSFFEYGNTVEINCQSLWLGAYGKTIVLGEEPADTSPVTPITVRNVNKYIIRTTSADTLSDVRLASVPDLSNRQISTLITLRDVEFAESERGKTWCDNDTVATYRHLVNRSGDTLRVVISPYSAFAKARIPSGSGSINGILYNYSGKFELRFASPYNIAFKSESF